ncbi:MAG: 50S ribosomal protein L3 [Gammaproteobacteria bacterium]|nr:50S ribosomal protein L3 [Gammaproteobacteria bacterium]
MAIGVIGTKSGMTRVFTDAGESIPVTVIVATPNRVTQVKTQAADGYDAVQVTAGAVKSGRVSRPLAGHFSKANAEAGRGLWEFRLDSPMDELTLGAEIGVEQFEKGQIVDVAGVSKGKGFAGAIKRWNFRSQDASHGNSVSHRAPGSIGQCQTPGRVFKGKKMAGQLGNRRVTVQNLTVVDVVPEKHLLLIKGAVPGAPGADICVRPATKRRPGSDAE